MPAMSALADYRDGKIRVTFNWDPAVKDAVKGVPGARFLPADKGGPAWVMPADLTTARRLREAVGLGLKLTPALTEWGRQEVSRERNLGALNGAETATLSRLPAALPALHAFIGTRPYQLADAAFMGLTNAANANQPGLGKTVETIAAIVEAGLEDGPNLIVAPVTSLDVVWEYEIKRFLPDALVLNTDDPAERPTLAEQAAELAREGKAFWLLINPDVIRPGRAPALLQVHWNTVVIDEFHMMGLSNPSTQGAKGAKALKARRRYALSGTPMGGKPIKLWGLLNWLEPEQYSSRWRWAEQWLVMKPNRWAKTGKEITHRLLPGREADFDAMLAKHMVRRLKSEVLKELPPKQFVDVWVKMTKTQAKQYKEFERDAELVIDEQHLVGDGILAQYTRLKQFAGARCEMVKGVPWPTIDSGKLPYLLDRLRERGITGDDDEWGDEKVVIATQFDRMAQLVVGYLETKGIMPRLLHGATKKADRTEIIREFQGKTGPRVLVMTTQTGGVSITLDRADSVHILDETWNPDDQEQLADRLHRGSRIHQVTVYTYRTRGTIEEDVHALLLTKAAANRSALDLHRARRHRQAAGQ